MSTLHNTFGTWALVTGASSGIGKEFAYQLAEKGFNLILLARREYILEEIAKDLETRFSIQVKFQSFDLSKEIDTQVLEDLTKGLKLGLLVSNAGDGRMGSFNKLPINSLEGMIQLNVTSHLQLSHWYTSKLLKENKTGGLILLSSTTAFQGTPYATNYSASKAYVLTFGEALHYELKSKGIHVSVLAPGPTDTPGLNDNKDADLVSHLPTKPQDVKDLVKEGLNAILKNKPLQIGGASNRVMFKMMKLLFSRKAASAFWGKMMYKMVN